MNYEAFLRRVGVLMERAQGDRNWDAELHHFELDELAHDVIIELTLNGPDAYNKATALAPVYDAIDQHGKSMWYA